VPQVIVTPEAEAALDRLIKTHSLPADTRERLRRSIKPLESFPYLGRDLDGEGFAGLQFVLGPWRWMVVVYEYDVSTNTIGVLSVQDAHSSSAATNFRT
jgi:plasmid stabilization system protein ParE